MTSSAPSPYYLAPADGEHLHVITDSVRILADTQTTGGRLLILIETAAPHAGPPLHRHANEDEYFYILSGRFRFVVNGTEYTADPGAFLCAPKGSVHTFTNIAPDNQPSTMLVIATPPGLEIPFRTCHTAGPTMPMPDLIAAFAKANITFLGPPLQP
jgi:quercetin dioxygenase-like cupin family protein